MRSWGRCGGRNAKVASTGFGFLQGARCPRRDAVLGDLDHAILTFLVDKPVEAPEKSY